MRPAALALAAAAATMVAAASAQPAETQGYLAAPALDLVQAFAPPPAAGSPEEAADRAAYRASLAGVGSPAWTRAIEDRAERPAEMIARMACATGRTIDPGRTPLTLAFVTRAQADLSPLVRAVKARYARPRPYAGDDPAAPLCEPVPPERRSPGSPSYPSGHAAEAALTGDLLASLIPGRAGEILWRARQYGEARIVCRVHYPSDVRAGQRLAAALYARLQADPGFRRDRELARRELARVPAGASPPACAH